MEQLVARSHPFGYGLIQLGLEVLRHTQSSAVVRMPSVRVDCPHTRTGASKRHTRAESCPRQASPIHPLWGCQSEILLVTSGNEEASDD